MAWCQMAWCQMQLEHECHNHQTHEIYAQLLGIGRVILVTYQFTSLESDQLLQLLWRGVCY